MSDNFFYDMNKKLQQVVDAPKSEHKQLNERSEKWIQGAVDPSHKGDLHKALHVAQDKKIPKSKIEKATHSKDAHLRHMAQFAKNVAKEDAVEEGMLDSLKAGVKKVAKKGLEKLGHGSDEAMRADLQKKMGLPPTGKKPVGEEYGPMEGGAPMTAKQKKFAKLAPPTDKITFADKIAGAKKEVDEMLGDVAADAIKKAVTSKGGKVIASKGVTKHHAGPGVYGGSEPDVHPLDRLKGPSKKKLTGKEETDEGSDWSQLGKEYSRPKVGTITHGHKHDIEQTATGQRVTRRTDPNTGHSVGADDDTPANGEKRGRGRPAGSKKAMGAKGPSGKSKLMTKEADHDQGDVKAAMALLKKAGYKVEKAEEELDEKAVSKAQQRFMGMVHATQKGEKAPSKEVAKVAKSMKKKDAEDFASTKHKGLPEKKKPEGKKKEKTEEAGGTGTPTASSGFGFGKGIYDSMNRELENMIAESMSINMSDSTEGGKSLTITATDDDAMKLAEIIRNAGIGGAAPEAGEVEVVGIDSPISGDEGHDHSEPCETCGSADCGCGDVEEALAENEPDWPTDEVVSDDALQYSGGLNKPKTTVAGDGQTTVPVTAVQVRESEEQYKRDLRKLLESAGIEVTDEMLEEGWKEKLGAAGLAGAMALGSLGAGAAQAAPQQGIDAPTAATQQQKQDVWQPAYQRAHALYLATKNPDLKQELQRLDQSHMDQSHGVRLMVAQNKNLAPKAAQEQKQLDLKYKTDLEQLLQRYNANESVQEQEQVREDAEAGNKEALAKEIYDLGYNIHQNDRYGQDTSQEEAKLKQLNAQFAQQFPGEDAFKIGSAINDREYAARQNQRNIQHQQDQEVAARTSNVMQKAKRGLGGMYEQEQVMAPESIDEAKEMCEVCEATPCKCDESVEESIARFRSLAGIQEAAKPDFTDVDKDGDKEESWKKAEKDKEEKKVEESIFNMTNLWKAYKG